MTVYDRTQFSPTNQSVPAVVSGGIRCFGITMPDRRYAMKVTLSGIMLSAECVIPDDVKSING